jgi:DNA-directed RNA polymerase specialized sigma subunit
VDIQDLFSEDDVDERLDAQRALAQLSVRDAAIVYLFACGHTQAEIGERVGVTQARICQLLANIYKNAQKSGVVSDATYGK